MKKILISILVIIIPVISLAQGSVNWDFSIKPGSEKWKALKTNNEKIEAQQIPPDILKNISTKDLVKLCLNFPAFGFYTAYDNPQTGFIVISGKFNGLKELSKRKDALIELIEIYNMADENGFNSSVKGISTEYWTIKLGWIELLLSQRKFLESGTNEDKRKLMRICIEKYNMKSLSKKFSSAGTESTLLLMARILDVSNNQAYKERCLKYPEVKEFTDTSVLKGENVVNEVIQLSKQFQMNSR